MARVSQVVNASAALKLYMTVDTTRCLSTLQAVLKGRQTKFLIWQMGQAPIHSLLGSVALRLHTEEENHI